MFRKIRFFKTRGKIRLRFIRITVKLQVKQDITQEDRNAMEFVSLLEEGNSATKAYVKVFGSIEGEARTTTAVKASRYKKDELVKKYIDRSYRDKYMYFADKHFMALEAQFDLAMNANSEKVRADALHQFISNTSKPLKTEEEADAALTANRVLLDKITDVFISMGNANNGSKEEYVEIEPIVDENEGKSVDEILNSEV